MSKEIKIVMPKTFAEIKANFPGMENKKLREEIFAGCLRSGGFSGRDIGFTASGREAIKAINAVALPEWEAQTAGAEFVGENESSEVVAQFA